MSKKRQNGRPKPEVEKQSEYYRLKTQAVDDLVTANEDNSPPVSEEELRAYRSGPKMKVAGWVKVLFIKAWFAGAVCFFFIWGLGGLLGSELDILFVTGMALGVVTDLMTNPVLRFFEKTKGENARWMMVNRKSSTSATLTSFCSWSTPCITSSTWPPLKSPARRTPCSWAWSPSCSACSTWALTCCSFSSSAP